MGTQTLSKAPDRFVDGVTPKFIKKAKGSHVWDVDGNEFIDYPMGLGAIVLGHADIDVNIAVTDAIQDGTIFTLMSPDEVELAELLIKLIPCAEMVRFAKNGSDATMGAIRIARAYTGRDHIAFCGYHGCHDWYAITGGLRRGIPTIMGQMIHKFEYNKPETLVHVLNKNKCAAVIMEQGLDEPDNHFLSTVAEYAHKAGAVFILDEVVTGFRYALGGVQEVYGVRPDIACVGKAMANGFPISAIVGKKEIMQTMEDGVFFSFTFGGDRAAIHAALATIKKLQDKDVIPQLWNKGTILKGMIKDMEKNYELGMVCHGNPVRFVIKFYDEWFREDLIAKSYFLQETVKRGILFGVPTFVTYAHETADLVKTLEVCDFVLAKMKKIRGEYEKHLEGKPIAPPIIRT